MNDGAFMEEYFWMLPVRAAKIFKGLSGRDVEPTLEALISLKVSSVAVTGLDGPGRTDISGPTS
jgi:hypothetical protein